MKVLVTGGAGFIGSHVVDALLEHGYGVRVLDTLDPQVHSSESPPEYLNREVEFVRGDVRRREDVNRVLEGVEAVFHFAAAVGVGQSQYQAVRYIDANIVGTANVIEALVEKRSDTRKLIVAGSMSVYGEGAGSCAEHGIVEPTNRSEVDISAGLWETRCPVCGNFLKPAPVPETIRPEPSSVYAVTKLSQEQMALVVGKTHGIPVTVLRFFNVYGPRQALSNPYTGVAAIFASRIKHGNPPVIFEDGGQSRDFVHVQDVARACIAALEREEATGGVFNVGTGKASTVDRIARLLAKAMGTDIEPEITNKFRKGDIRHCVADIALIRERLGFEPQIFIEKGIVDLAKWAVGEDCEDFFDTAHKELVARGLAPAVSRKE